MFCASLAVPWGLGWRLSLYIACFGAPLAVLKVDAWSMYTAPSFLQLDAKALLVISTVFVSGC